ncbi:MAG TPA: TIGR00282 family metallophosphoesterase [Gaiellaceae bacterium]|nr:TIGR00282 family metallophosphoesterase [Gaiellaceae bacterium]
MADVVGLPGRRALEERLSSLRKELDVDICIVNGENVADGVGITPKLAKKLFEFGADAITLGNHTWRRPEVVGWIDTDERVVRPANFSKHAPGRALTFVPARDGTTVAVINVMGYLFLEVAYNPFEVIDDLVEEARAQTPVVFVDMHGEATSEKVALSRWLDGRVTAVIGTHTHVQTNDARVQAGGTAALTDAGMTGPHDSVIGVTAEQAISRMRTGLPVRFETAQGGIRIEGALVECTPDGRATRCETVRVEVT